MNFIWLLILFTFIITINIQYSLCATAIQQIKSHPDFPYQCFDDETNKAIDVGSSIQLKDECGIKTCHQNYINKDLLAFHYSTCGVIHLELPDGCTWKTNINKPYPDCCQPIIQCNNQQIANQKQNVNQPTTTTTTTTTELPLHAKRKLHKKLLDNRRRILLKWLRIIP